MAVRFLQIVQHWRPSPSATSSTKFHAPLPTEFCRREERAVQPVTTFLSLTCFEVWPRANSCQSNVNGNDLCQAKDFACDQGLSIFFSPLLAA